MSDPRNPISSPALAGLGRTALALGLLLAAAGRPAVAEVAKIYWSDRAWSEVSRASADGTDAEVLVSGDAWAIALDEESGHLYWAENDTGKIRRSLLDGSDPVDVLDDSTTPSGIALDVAGGKIYWSEGSFSREIHRANLDGSDPERIVEAQGGFGFSTPSAIALDIESARIYWVDFTTNKVHGAAMDGSGEVDTLYTLEGGANPEGIALASGELYVTLSGKGKIQKGTLSGDDEISDVITGLGMPRHLAVDAAGGRMYWVDSLDDSLESADLDGTDRTAILDGADGLSLPFGIALGSSAAVGLTITGSCPGTITLEVTDATPSGTVTLLRGTYPGLTVLPGGPCPGLEVDLDDVARITALVADETGGLSVSRTVANPLACGTAVQVVDHATCTTTNVDHLP